MLLSWLARRLARFLSQRIEVHTVSTSTFDALAQALEPGDVLLVDGDTRISVAIKYLTQSTWSHSALYLGPDAGLPVSSDGEPHVLIEADLQEGIRTVTLSEYREMHTRICRPVGLSLSDISTLTQFACSRLGQPYDLRNVFDLARYLVSRPPVPVRYRRHMLAFGSGDPTRAICSTFIAQAFQRIRYPILPERIWCHGHESAQKKAARERFLVRHYSLFVPRDFDASPYFQIIKPSLGADFDFRTMPWDDRPDAGIC